MFCLEIRAWKFMILVHHRNNGEFLQNRNLKAITIRYIGKFLEIVVRVSTDIYHLYELFNIISLKHRRNIMQITYDAIEDEAKALRAVQQRGYALQWVKDPSEAVILAAVQQDGYALQRVKDPSEAVILAAVQQRGMALQWVKDPSEAVILAAVQQDGYALQWVKDPSEAVILAAVQQRGMALKWVKDRDLFKKIAEQCGHEPVFD
jgi:regulator of extracellular matrix RemA (YlzA/DUF370 family)